MRKDILRDGLLHSYVYVQDGEATKLYVDGRSYPDPTEIETLKACLKEMNYEAYKELGRLSWDKGNMSSIEGRLMYKYSDILHKLIEEVHGEKKNNLG